MNITKKIRILTGYIEDIQPTDTKELDINTTIKSEDVSIKKYSNETGKPNNNGKDKDHEICCNGCLLTNPLFLGTTIFMCFISILFFLYLINLFYQVTHPKGVEAVQSDSMFFDYLVTDIFTVHNSTISTHERELSINFNSPYGVNFNDMQIIPDGTISAKNCNFSEINFQKIKIRGSTILSITPQNDEVIFDLPTVSMGKSLSAMELDCSGFIIKNGKLFDSTGIELTWPSPGDSRYSFLSNSKTSDQFIMTRNDNDKKDYQIFNVHSKNSIFDHQNSPNDHELTKTSLDKSEILNQENMNYIIPVFSNQNLYKKHKIKENFNQRENNFKCSNISASYDSFACISASRSNDLAVIFAQCLDSKCKNARKSTINISHIIKTNKIEKMLIFNNTFISILLKNRFLYIFDNEGSKVDEILNVDDIDVVNDGAIRYLLYLQNNNLYQYRDNIIISFQNTNKVTKFSSEIFKSKLIVFTNCSENQQKENSAKENLLLFCNQGNIGNFVVDKNGIIFAIDSINHQTLICNTKNLKCDNFLNFESEKYIQISPSKRGGFIAITTDKDSKLSYHFINKKISKSSKAITTKTSEIVDEVALAKLEGKYPRIFAIKKGIVTITHCSNSKCLPGFAN